MKTIKIYSSLLLTLLILSSCTKDVIEVSSTTQISAETFFQTESDAQLAITGVYSSLGDFASQLLYLDAVADNAYNNYPWEGYKAIALGTHDVWGPWAIGAYWNMLFKGIGRANVVLANIDDIEMDATAKSTIKGEALFLRAYFYLNLADLYGGVPIITEAPSLEHGLLPRNTKAEVMSQIVLDLDAAATALPPTAGPGRANSNAALALKTRTLLYNEQWAEAASAASQVMGKYSLYPDYRALFMIENENNQEVIFDAQFISPEQGHHYDTYFGPSGAGGWSSIMPLPELVNDYHMTDGLPTSTSPLYDAGNPYDNRDPRLKQTIFVPGTIVNGIPFEDLTTFTGFAFKKYTPLDEDFVITPAPYSALSGLNVILLRYADILLMYAEAKNEDSGPDQSVLDAINEVRSRASVMMPDIASGLSQAEMREVIRHERRVEFPAEGTRYSDIRRWKTAESLMNGLVDPGGTRVFNAGRDYLWPIPGGEFDLPDTALTQNPNYGN